jgi:hypothetical protein
MSNLSFHTSLVTTPRQTSSSHVSLANMPAPANVSALQWQMASTTERQALLDAKPTPAQLYTTTAQNTLGQLAQAAPIVMATEANSAPTLAKIQMPPPPPPATTTTTTVISPSPKRKKRRRFGGLAKLKSHIKNHIKKSLKKALAKLKKNFQKLMQSKLFAAVLMVCRFIPIPIVQLAVKIIDLVKAAYTLYQGIKAGSMGAILGGISGVAGGISDMASSLGASSLAKTAGNVAKAANKSAVAYNAIAKKDYGAALDLFANSGSNAQTRWGNMLSGAVKANSAYKSVRSGDYAGALNTGVNAAKDFNGRQSNATLTRLGTMANTVGQIDQTARAVRQGNYVGALSAGSSVATSLGLVQSNPNDLPSSTMKALGTVAKVVDKVNTVSQAIQQHNYLKAANDALSTYTALQDTATLAPNSTVVSLGKFTAAAHAIHQSAQQGRYAQADQTAVTYLRALHGDQPNKTLDRVTDMVNAFSKLEQKVVDHRLR